MNIKYIIAFILVVFGILVLAYSGITFTTPGEPVVIFGMHLETTHSHFIPPATGVLMIVGGIVLFIVKVSKV